MSLHDWIMLPDEHHALTLEDFDKAWARIEAMWPHQGMGANFTRKMVDSADLPKNIESVQEISPLYVEPFKAWRAWEIIDHPTEGLMLQSITHKVGWPYYEPFEAVCIYQVRGTYDGKPHVCPNLKHRCGIYALKAKQDALNWTIGSTPYASRAKKNWAIGQVHLWGHVMQFQYGYIAQYAYPEHLLLDPEIEIGNVTEVAQELAMRYGVPVHSRQREEEPKREDT